MSQVREDVLTCFTVDTSEATRTLTGIRTICIHTRAPIFTWLLLTLVNVCNNVNIKSSEIIPQKIGYLNKEYVTLFINDYNFDEKMHIK